MNTNITPVTSVISFSLLVIFFPLLTHTFVDSLLSDHSHCLLSRLLIRTLTLGGRTHAAQAEFEFKYATRRGKPEDAARQYGAHAACNVIQFVLVNSIRRLMLLFSTFCKWYQFRIHSG